MKDEIESTRAGDGNALTLSDEQIDAIVDRHYRHKNHPDSYSALRATIKDALAAAPAVSAPAGIIERIESAMKRIEAGHSIRRIPADPTDPDLVLAECKALFEGRWPPFWIKGTARTEIPAPVTAPTTGEK